MSFVIWWCKNHTDDAGNVWTFSKHHKQGVFTVASSDSGRSMISCHVLVVSSNTKVDYGTFIMNEKFRVRPGQHARYRGESDLECFITVHRQAETDLEIAYDGIAGVQDCYPAKPIKVFVDQALQLEPADLATGVRRKFWNFGYLFEGGEIFSDDQLTDLKVQFEDATFHVHALVLSRMSSVWRRALMPDMKEGQERAIDVTDSKFAKEDFKAFLLAIYHSEKLDGFDLKTLCYVYRLADKYDVSGIVESLPDVLNKAKLVTPESICYAMDLAYTLGLQDVLGRCFAKFPVMTGNGSGSACAGDPSKRGAMGEVSVGAGGSGAGFFASEAWVNLVARVPMAQITLSALGKLK